MSRNTFVVVKRKVTENGFGQATNEIVKGLDGRTLPFVEDESDVLYQYAEQIKTAGGREAVAIILHPFG